MTNNENYLRNRLYNMEASYPEDMWDRIEANIPEKKDDRKLWLFFLILLLGAMVPASIFMSAHFSTQNNSEKSNNITISKYSENAAISESNTLEDESDYNANTTIEGYDKNNSQAIIVTNESEQHEKIIHGNLKSNENIDPLIPASSGSDLEEFKGNTSEHDSEKLVSEDNFEKNQMLRNSLLDIPKLNVPFDELTYLFEFDPPECPTFTFGTESGMYIDFVYSHDYGMQSLTAKSQEFNPYVGERENTESPLYSFSAGVRISYISGSGLGLKTGINYSQINEKFEYLDPDASLIRTIITIDTLLVGGVPTVVSDTSTIRIPGSLDITAYNRYKFIDIPILLTYEAYLTEKFYYNINAGALINLSFTQKGRFLDPSGDPVWFTSSDPTGYDAFKSSAAISLYGSIGLHYQLSSTFDLIIEPNFRLFTGSLTNESYPLEQKWLTGGLITGLRYKF